MKLRAQFQKRPRMEVIICLEVRVLFACKDITRQYRNGNLFRLYYTYNYNNVYGIHIYPTICIVINRNNWEHSNSGSQSKNNLRMWSTRIIKENVANKRWHDLRINKLSPFRNLTTQLSWVQSHETTCHRNTPPSHQDLISCIREKCQHTHVSIHKGQKILSPPQTTR